MKRLFTVTYEWKLAGKDENYMQGTVNIVAKRARDAVDAAIKTCRKGFVEKLSDVRLHAVTAGPSIDEVL
jgi:acylphosphatase